MIRFNRILVASGLLIFASQAHAADWKYLATNSQNTEILVDVSSVSSEPPIEIQRPFPVIKIWTKFDHSSDKSVPERKTVVLFSINCSNTSSAALSTIKYAADGGVLKSWTDEDYSFNYRPDAPDTVGYAISEFACGRRALPDF